MLTASYPIGQIARRIHNFISIPITSLNYTKKNQKTYLELLESVGTKLRMLNLRCILHP